MGNHDAQIQKIQTKNSVETHIQLQYIKLLTQAKFSVN
ncbi:hypothetical protein SynWH8103_00155 [Synechococcus sp. WH 8103]|nr:hypothetical protein SynWH8103_00155 [Synechococcus sp. WH 8103]